MSNSSDDDGSLRTAFLVIVIITIVIAAILIPSPPDEVPTIEKVEPEVHVINEAYAAEPEPEPKEVKLVVKKSVPDLHPELAVICSCESAGHPHKNEDGELLSGYVDNDDKGECQINTRYHGETMERMGLDINDDADYRTYANYLFETQGRSPWMASASCWAPIIGY